MASVDLDRIDLVDPDSYVDDVPWAWFDALRRERPVTWHEETAPNHGFWSVTRYQDLLDVHMDWETYSSEKGAVIDWGDAMIGNQDPEYSAAVVDRVDTEEFRLLPFRSPIAREVFAYGRRQRDLRLEEPTEDVITALTVAQQEGILSERDYDNYFSLLMIAGNETTRHTISHGMLALMEHPEQLRALQEDPSLIPTAVEEVLRWATPVMHFRRTATRDVELGGQRIRAGDKVVTWYISANRDETAFEDPYRFDIRRQPNQHVTFGPGGPHFCLGAHLARLETKVLFQELLPRLASIERTGPVERMRSNFVHGIKHLPVRVRLR